MERLTQLLARLSEALGTASLVAMTAMVVVDIFLRTLLNQSLGFVEEVTGYLVAIVTFFGVSLTFREGAMFRVSFLYEKFPGAMRRALNVVYLGVAIVFCAVMIWFTSLLVWSSFTRGKLAATELQTPVYIPQLVLPLGFALLLVFVVHKLLQGSANQSSSESRPDEATGD